jgi:glutaredoxin-like YruB-family protein
MKKLWSLDELKSEIRKNERTFVLIYKEGNSQSECALSNLSSQNFENIYTVDVNKVKDIHPEFGITTVPVLLYFEKSELKNQIKGCQSFEYYRSLIENKYNTISFDQKPTKRVIVYSTPTCSWCNTLKSYLRKNGIRFVDIDVSRDQRAAEELVRRTGQQGVPQTDIDGQIVVGFDKAKIDLLLGLK